MTIKSLAFGDVTFAPRYDVLWRLSWPGADGQRVSASRPRSKGLSEMFSSAQTLALTVAKEESDSGLAECCVSRVSGSDVSVTGDDEWSHRGHDGRY